MAPNKYQSAWAARDRGGLVYLTESKQPIRTSEFIHTESAFLCEPLFDFGFGKPVAESPDRLTVEIDDTHLTFAKERG